MWIIRFQKIKPSDYNFINRLLKKSGFVSRKFSSVILVKASILYLLQRKSWRVLAKEFWVWYIALYNFYSFIKNKKELKEIFHRFIDKRVVLFVGKEKLITKGYLDNNKFLIILTKQELESRLY